MDVAQELAQLWNFLLEQERRILELRRSVLAMTEILKSQPHVFDSYRTTLRDLSQSELMLRSEQSLRDIERKMRELAEQRPAG
jgi:Mg2+ and Co2+ transporter CorA